MAFFPILKRKSSLWHAAVFFWGCFMQNTSNHAVSWYLPAAQKRIGQSRSSPWIERPVHWTWRLFCRLMHTLSMTAGLLKRYQARRGFECVPFAVQLRLKTSDIVCNPYTEKQFYFFAVGCDASLGKVMNIKVVRTSCRDARIRMN